MDNRERIARALWMNDRPPEGLPWGGLGIFLRAVYLKKADMATDDPNCPGPGKYRLVKVPG